LNGEKYILSVNIVKYNGINRDRNGTENDERAIITTFKKYHGFKQKPLCKSGNVKQNELLQAVKKFVANTPEKPHNLKMLTFVIMCHGNQDGWIETSDGKTIRLLKVLEPILVSPKFTGIPKLVICQFCRGNFMNSAAIMDGQPMTDRVNGQTDMIILHATAEGNPALRNGKTGASFFIQELCQQLSRRNDERFIRL